MYSITDFEIDKWGETLAYILLFSLVLIFARIILGLVTRYDVNKELTDKDNVAYSVSMTGYFIGVSIVFLGASMGSSQGLWKDLLVVGGYSFGGVLAMFVSRFINDHLIFHHISNMTEIREKKNIAVGIVQLASYIATGLMIGSAIAGDDGGPGEAVLFYFIGQIFLVSYTKGFVKFSRYDIQSDLKSQNVSISLSVAGKMIAIGLIVMMTLGKEFLGWKETFVSMFIDCSIMTILLFFSTILFDKVIIPKSDLYNELVKDRNIGVGLLDCMMSIIYAMLMVYFV
ncbi:MULTISPECIES: DUF350 domain-containing protein [Flammeovirga]|uniref:DUF350 domain-containing protein n=1 Tax=Flammeovirga agarivorans TaxID=2726742 RepID=A0A7X8XV64_9BACT|nr:MULTISPECIES: DUF350 domain-containing protein [Flammeovirga]NLR90785.1 DUF350 domain-containing protein [Flammeovirga agarivorans]